MWQMIERMQLFLYLTPGSKEEPLQQNYTTIIIEVSSDWKKMHGKKLKNFVIFFFINIIFIKVAANWQLLTPFVSKEQRWN